MYMCRCVCMCLYICVCVPDVITSTVITVITSQVSNHRVRCHLPSTKSRMTHTPVTSPKC